MWNKLFAPVNLLNKGLEASWLRNSVIRNNLANVETPGFKSSDVEFESLFARALQAEGIDNKITRAKHRPLGEPDLSLLPLIVENNDTSMRMDGNNVDVESENVKLAQNSILYNTIEYKLNSELTRLKLAITEGK